MDPAHFYTAPGLSWGACLKMTNVELELLTDIDMHLFIEGGLRGGISVICNRYSKANNKYLPNFRPDEESKYIMYLDANNLYGYVMSQSLPIDSFAWLSKDKVDELDISNVSDDSDIGYILEVDLVYPPEVHDLHSDFPLAPQKMKVTDEMLSPYFQQLKEDLDLKEPSIAKLVPNLYDKTRYILHYKNLKLYLELGMKLMKIHRVLSFQQSPWLKPYIDFNTEKRRRALNDFEKDFFKLMNNSMFGKTCENLRNRVNVELVTTEKRLNKLTKAPSFDHFKIFTPDIAAVNLKKTTLYLNRPIYAGFTILELSKVLMFDFYYDYVKKNYGSRAKLLFTDTDSLCLEVKTQDIYEDMASDVDLFDFSDYPRDHFLHSVENKKVIGKMKDELYGIPIEEFVGLRPKMYSLLYTEHDKAVEKKTAKGIAKHVTKKKIKHEHYKDCLFNRKLQMASMKQLRSFQHNIFSIKLNKIGLSPFDNKRYILGNGCDTLSYGHYALRDTHLDQHDQELIELLADL